MAAIALRQRLEDGHPKPFLKWAGGKSRLVPEILARFPERFGRYHEPFLGGGAVFFALLPRSAMLSDVNIDLIRTYRAVRDNVEQVIERLSAHPADQEHYYSVRAQAPDRLSVEEAAARTLFLNRTCYNGLYRVNSHGQFNVPFGRYKNPKICNADNLRTAAQALRSADIRHQNVFAIEDRVERGDLVYLDPPYDPMSSTASFTAYAKEGFGPDEQARLADLFARLARRGVHVVLSNSDTPLINRLYRGFQIDQVFVRRAINSRADRRGPVSEVLVSSRPNR